MTSDEFLEQFPLSYHDWCTVLVHRPRILPIRRILEDAKEAGFVKTFLELDIKNPEAVKVTVQYTELGVDLLKFKYL